MIQKNVSHLRSFFTDLGLELTMVITPIKESHCFTEKCQSDCIYIYFAVWGNYRFGYIEKKTGFYQIGGVNSHIIKILQSFKLVIP